MGTASQRTTWRTSVDPVKPTTLVLSIIRWTDQKEGGTDHHQGQKKTQNDPKAK